MRSTETVVVEMKIVDGLFAELANVHRTAPDYFIEFESNDPLTVNRAELVSLIARAPSAQIKFFLFGQLAARLAFSASGRWA